MSRLNWEVGLSRIYVVLVAIWVTAWTFYLRDAFTQLSAWGPADFKAAAIIYVVCPIIGYLGLAALKWILRGFARDRHKDGDSSRTP